MLERSERAPGGAMHHISRFDSESVRRILQRAAEEQHRLDKELADNYSLEELEEMAAEVRISPEALRAAIEAHRRDAGARTGAPGAPQRRPSGWLEGRMPETWSPTFKHAVLASVSVLALSGLLLSLWIVAPTLFWATSLSLILLSLLVLLGASPF